MKINPSQIAKAMEIYKAQKPSVIHSGKKKGQENDELVLSDKAQAFQLALKAMEKDDGVDLAKVKKLKKQIETGEYNVSSREIADKIVNGLLPKNGI